MTEPQPHAQSEQANASCDEAVRMTQIVHAVRRMEQAGCRRDFPAMVEEVRQINIQTAFELVQLVVEFFQAARRHPVDCEAYVDLALALQEEMREFPSDSETEKTCTFMRLLICSVQSEFETIPTKVDSVSTRKKEILTLMEFIGHLFQRGCLKLKVIGNVIHDLIGADTRIPEEHLMECACQLLQVIASMLHETIQRKHLAKQFATRLMELKNAVRHDGESAYSEQCKSKLQELVDELWPFVSFRVSRMSGEVLVPMVEQRLVSRSWSTTIHFIKKLVRDKTGAPMVEQRLVWNDRLLTKSDDFPRASPGETVELTMVQHPISALPRTVICIMNLPIVVRSKVDILRRSLSALLRRIAGRPVEEHGFLKFGFMLAKFPTELAAQNAIRLNGYSAENLMLRTFRSASLVADALQEDLVFKNLTIEVRFLQDAVALPAVDAGAQSMVDSLLGDALGR